MTVKQIDCGLEMWRARKRLNEKLTGMLLSRLLISSLKFLIVL
jgi:hypothetical protein